MAVIGRGSPFLVGSAVTLLATFALRAAPRHDAAPVHPLRRRRPRRSTSRATSSRCSSGTATSATAPRRARGRLRLHAPDYIAKGGQSGPVVVAGDTEQSLLMRRVLGLDGEDRMPLDADPLSDAEMATLRGWIASGAAMPAAPARTTAAADVVEHWAYVKPVRPALPAVSRQAWVRTPIDRFVLARLEREKLSPSRRGRSRRRCCGASPSTSPACRRRPRRSTPSSPTPRPTPTSASSIACSPRRTTASAGRGRGSTSPATPTPTATRRTSAATIWKYRDWVIDALNADMPFDRFTIEQIAGDMLPDATDGAADRHRLPSQHDDQRGRRRRPRGVACTRCSSIASTRRRRSGSARTLGCAQCHNHKYDPFSQKDYYRLLAFFANPAYETQVSGDGTRYPKRSSISRRRSRRRSATALQAEIKRLEGVLAETTPELAERQRAWEDEMRAADQRLDGARAARRHRDQRRPPDARSRTDRSSRRARTPS